MIAIGDVVRETFGREGVVCSTEPRPAEAWIEEQVDREEVKKLGDVKWWGVMPFGGGYLLCPEPMLERLRRATYVDFLRLVETASIAGRENLAKTFPEYVDRLLSERQPH